MPLAATSGSFTLRPESRNSRMETSFIYGVYNRDSAPEYVYTIPNNTNNVTTVDEEVEPPKYNTLNKRQFVSHETKSPFYTVEDRPPQTEPISAEWLTISIDDSVDVRSNSEVRSETNQAFQREDDRNN